MALSAVGLLAFRNPFADLVAIVWGKGDLRSMFCLVVFLIVFLVLAYLTNPSENSFRAYLTEQSFRLHLSRLDENADDSHASRYSSTSSLSAPPFHFASRASIALRTPKHVFHSFAIFTIAAMVPLSKTADGQVRDGWMISDSWYIGAFGKWWRGGVLEAWYQDVIARSKDEEGWSSGILSMNRLDMLPDYNGPTFSAKNLPSHLMRGSPPRLRNRERPALKITAVQPRSSTPPPLPKSVSLPMHATRKSLSSTDRPCDRSSQVQPHAQTQPCLPNDNSRRGSATPSRSSPASLEHSPLIAEVLRQITTTKASVLDLRTQLSECESAASQSHAVLQHEVDMHRDRKRQEDASKLELKTRTKSLEDSKRGAESMKKDAEKKLKSIQSFRDTAAQRMDYLDQEITGLRLNLSEDRDFILHQGQMSDEERDITQHLEQKRLEIKEAEDLLLILNHRSRELEDKLTSEKERLETLRGESEKLKQTCISSHAFPSHLHTQDELWISSPGTMPSGDTWEPPFLPTRQTSGVYDIDDRALTVASLRSGGQNSSSFMPFDDLDLSHAGDAALFPLGKANGSLQLADNVGAVSRSFQSDSDPFIDREREWRYPSYPSHYQNDDIDARFPVLASSSPTASTFESHPFNTTTFQEYAQTYAASKDLQSSNWGPMDDVTSFEMPSLEHSVPRRWFSGFNKDKSTKGLNPDAKEFSLFRKPVSVFSGRLSAANTGYDALNPTGLMPTNSSSSTNQSLLRAFAPSPAEREALQRALGGSTNTSFERLPSLSDVGSIPASPTNAHALPHHHHTGRDLGSLLPAWLQALPRARKAKFSPWEDEEPSTLQEINGVKS